MELFQLTYAVMLGKTCNFSKAAQRLFITQPTLSYQIQRLEKEVGFPLFLRTSKGVSITIEGRQFLKMAGSVLKEYEKLAKAAQELSQSFNAELILGTSPLSSIHISEGISAFVDAFPQVHLQLIESWDVDLVEMLRREELDVALLCVEDISKYMNQLIVHPIQDEYLCAVVNANHPLAGKESLSVEHLQQERVVLDIDGSELSKAVQRWFENQGIVPATVMQLSSLDTRLSLARTGAVTFAMNEQIKKYLKDKKDDSLAVIPMEPRCWRSFGLVTTKEKNKSFVVQSFLEIAIEQVRKRFGRTQEAEPKEI